jgi:predicted aldo/keto reductase-like oxidoreductase
MKYRRFGRTELNMPVLSCGGMRYQHAWQDVDPAEIEAEGQQNLEATIRRALDLGINHIETARGYGTSEYQLGKILPSLPRDEMIVQTKIGPADSESHFMETFELSMQNLQLDHVDLLAVHGINNAELLEKTLTNGTIEACRKLQKQGRARHIGFSTHGDADAVLKAVESDAFDYVNLHWYYFDQRNWPAIEAATQRDMGVFIISPSDKGGKLYDPPQRLTDLCAPLTPMGFNDLFCLSRTQVHTLSIGAARPSDFDAHVAALTQLDQAQAAVAPVEAAIAQRLSHVMGEDWMTHWNHDLPVWHETPGQVPLYHVLRLLTMAKGLDMVEFGKMRYNLLGSGDHWFAGQQVGQVTLDEWDELCTKLASHPLGEHLPAALREVHSLLRGEPKKRLSQSE